MVGCGLTAAVRLRGVIMSIERRKPAKKANDSRLGGLAQLRTCGS